MLSDAKLRFSCITFGGPPIFGSPVTQMLAAPEVQLPRHGLLLAIVTEGDIIPRMDAAYAKEMAKLYHLASVGGYYAPTAGKVFDLPPLSLFRLGHIVVLFDVTTYGDLELGAYSLREEDLGERLWASFFQHHKSLYARWMKEVGAGRLNGGKG